MYDSKRNDRMIEMTRRPEKNKALICQAIAHSPRKFTGRLDLKQRIYRRLVKRTPQIQILSTTCPRLTRELLQNNPDLRFHFYELVLNDLNGGQ